MGILDILLGAAQIVDALSDNNTYFKVTCDTLEIFEIGTTWEGTARVHSAGKHLRTETVSYSTTIAMPKEGNSNYTRRGLLRKNLREWCGQTFANKSTVSKETIVLNKGENCLSCEGFIKKTSGKWIITNNSKDAEYYGAYKLYLTKEGQDVGYEDLEYYFEADTLGYISSVDVHDGF